MKKFIALLLVLVMTASLPVFVQAENADVSYTETDITLEYDLDNEENAIIPSNCQMDDDPSKIMKVPNSATDDPHGNVFQMPSGSIIILGSIDSKIIYKDTLVFDADYYFDNYCKAGKTVSLFELYKASGSPVKIDENGKIMLFDEEIGTVNKDTWFNIHFEYAFKKGKAYLTLTVGQTSTTFSADLPDGYTQFPTMIRLYSANFTTGDLYIDNVKISHKAPNYKMTFAILNANDTPAADTTKVSVNGSKIKLTFTEAMDATTFTTDNVKLADKAGNPVAYTGSFDTDNKIYTIELGTLSYKTEYTLTVKGVKTALGGYAHYTGDAPSTPAEVANTIAFKTEYPPFSIIGESVKSTSAGTTTYTVAVQNTTEEDKQGKVVEATYVDVTDENGVTYSKLSSIGVTPVSGTVGNNYDVTINDDGLTPETYLMDNDFKVIDIWEE